MSENTESIIKTISLVYVAITIKLKEIQLLQMTSYKNKFSTY